MEEIKYLMSKLFFSSVSFLSGTNFIQNLKTLQDYEKRNEKDIRKIQLKLLKKVVQIAYKEVPFYNRKYKKANVKPELLENLSDLSKFPIVTKLEMRKDYKSMLNRNYNIKKLKHTRSSGSTGEPKIFYYDNHTYGWRLASQFLGWHRAGFHLGEKWMRISIGDRNNLFYKMWNLFSRCIYIDLNQLNDKKLGEIVTILKRERPSMIYSYAISLYLIAEYLNKSGQKIDFVKTLISQGSVLFPDYRQTIEEAFGVNVVDTYGGDGIVISGQCERGNYHIQDLGVIVEIVDDSYTTISDGKKGRILVTDLRNYAMPIIRYEIGDLGVKLPKSCSCSSSFSIMEQPLGRDTDIIKLSNGTILMVHYFGILFKHYKGIIEFQVREIAKDSLKIFLVVDENYILDTEKSIKEEIINHCKCSVNIDIELVTNIPAVNLNKRRYVIGRNL